MTKVMSPSENSITTGQIGKLQELLGAGLRKASLQGESVQQVIEHRGNELVAEWIAIIQKRVEAISNLIVRHATVNRTRTFQAALDATGRKQYTNASVVAEAPQGENNEADVVFFNLGRDISDSDLEKEYEQRGLVPADPFALAAINEAYPAFADEHSNGTHWKDKNGKWCYAAFGRWSGERDVSVDRDGNDWDDFWWFAGRRK